MPDIENAGYGAEFPLTRRGSMPKGTIVCLGQRHAIDNRLHDRVANVRLNAPNIPPPIVKTRVWFGTDQPFFVLSLSLSLSLSLKAYGRLFCTIFFIKGLFFYVMVVSRRAAFFTHAGAHSPARTLSGARSGPMARGEKTARLGA